MTETAMGHVLLGNPGIERLVLHAALHRALLREGHRVTLLAHDPVSRRCMQAQGLHPLVLRPGRRPDLPRLTLRDLARRDARLLGADHPGPRELDRCAAALAERLGSIVRLFDTALPDVLVLFGARTGLTRLLDRVAREFGCAVLHLGDGLLPGTLQCDPLGVDGDAAACDRAALDYRATRPDAGFVDAALTATLADFRPQAAAGNQLFAPDAIDTVAALLAGCRRAQPLTTLGRVAAWRRVADRSHREPPAFRPELLAALPRGPFVTALLQHRSDPRLRLDAGDEPPGPADVLRAARRTALAIDPQLPVVALLPRGRWSRADRAALAADGIVTLPAADAFVAVTCAATAAAVVTANHPLGLAAILAGQPVLHFGRAPWAVPGIATRIGREPDSADVDAALAGHRPALRARFATRLLRDEHVWCDAERPDDNGLRGLARAVGDRLTADRSGPTSATAYVPGPPVLLLDELPDRIAEE